MGTIFELTLNVFKTIIVNLGVNYRQCGDAFCLGQKNALAHWHPKTKEGVNKYINPK
jgi:hypothetical protein